MTSFRTVVTHAHSETNISGSYLLCSSPDVELIPHAFTVKFTHKLSAAHVAEWVRQLHVDPVVPGSNPAGPEFFFHQFFYTPKLRYKVTFSKPVGVKVVHSSDGLVAALHLTNNWRSGFDPGRVVLEQFFTPLLHS